jgi:hypothetical protein
MDGLRWEAAHQPPAGASSRERAQFLAEVMRRTASITAREAAVKRARELPEQGDLLVPALLAVVQGPSLGGTDWSPSYAVQALGQFAWSADLDHALPGLLHLMTSDARQALRVPLGDLIAARGPVQASTVDAFIAVIRKGPDRPVGARQLGVLLARATASHRALVARGRKVLEQATRAWSRNTCTNERECEAMRLVESARAALAKLPEQSTDRR